MVHLRRILISLILSVGANSIAGDAVPNARPALAVQEDCAAEEDLSITVQRLSTPLSDAELKQVKESLLGSAGKSPACRKRVVSALMVSMDKPGLDLFRDQASFFMWNYGTELLGDLKATEALDLLIAHLTISDELSPSMSHYPAVKGIIAIGPLAIPKLAAVVGQSPDRDMRRYAVFCIARIGGPEAKRVLEEAQPSESDPCVSKFIRVTVNALDKKGYVGQTASEARSEWYSAFLCHQ